MKAQEFHGRDTPCKVPKEVKKVEESTLDARQRKIKESQCGDIFNADKKYQVKGKDRY